MSKAWEAFKGFFQGEDGSLSMSRLMTFLAYWPALFIVVWAKSETMADSILAAYVVQYGVSRYNDVKQTKANADAAAISGQ